MSRILHPYQSPQQYLWQATLLGPLQLVTPPDSTLNVVGVDEVMQGLRERANDQDESLQNYLQAATRLCELEIPGHRQFLTATYLVPVVWWFNIPIRLPRPPLQSVVSINYFDTGGNYTLLDPSIYLVRTPWRMPGTVERAPFKAWPALQADRLYPIEITFTAGYGVPEKVPSTIKLAIKLLANYWYENRYAASEVSAEDIPWGVRTLLDSEAYGAYA